MFVLTLRKGDGLKIGDSLVVVERGGRVSVEAPRSVPIVHVKREELRLIESERSINNIGGE
jgi:sRNA-binding carbon storage regulator CsrA